MANKRVENLEKKKPYNLSIKSGLSIAFDNHCKENSFNKNSLIESFMSEYLDGFNEIK